MKVEDESIIKDEQKGEGKKKEKTKCIIQF